jgi:alanine racemase
MSAHQGQLSIDLTAIRQNYLLLKEKVGGSCDVACTIKANAYGLGMEKIAPVLYDAGCWTFFVATPQEGLALRRIVKGAHIGVLNGFAPSAAKEFIYHNLIPVLNSLQQIQQYKDFAAQKGRALPAIVHFDTGMNRLGLDHKESQALVADKDMLAGLDVIAVMSHLACADEAQHLMNEQQYAAFTALAGSFPGVKRCLCNSAGIFRSENYHLEMVRPGMALYGLNPAPEKKNPMRPVVTLDAPILQLKSVGKGDFCGYNATYRFENDTVVAVVSTGYADGFMRSLSNEGDLFWKGYALPVRGRVSMDLAICDLADVPESELPVAGDMLEVIGEHQSADDLAKAAGTIGYEILTSLGGRYDRVYKGQNRLRQKAA